MLVRSTMPVVVSRWVATGLVIVLLATLSAGQAGAVAGGSESVSTADTLPGFSDVPADHVFAMEVAWLASTGITQGRGYGSFGLNDPVTRGAMAAFLYRYAGEPEGPFEVPDLPGDGSGADPDAPATADGQRWQQVAHDGAVFGGDGSQVMSSVATGGPGLVAVGADMHNGQAAVWTSP